MASGLDWQSISFKKSFSFHNSAFILPLKISLIRSRGHPNISTFREFSKRGSITDTGLWIRPSRTLLFSRMEPSAPSVHARPRRPLRSTIRSFCRDNSFQNCSLLDSYPFPRPPMLIPEKEMRIHRGGSLADAIGESSLPLWRRSNGVYDHEHGSSLKG